MNLFKKTLRTALCSCLLGLCLTGTALASPRGDGWAAHKAGRNDEAVTLLLQAVQEDPNDAKAYWFLAQVYDDLGRGNEGLQALQNARRLDPSLSFASNPSGVARLESSLSRKTGSSSDDRGIRRRRDTSSSASIGFPDQQEALRQIESNGVYVAPGLASRIDANQIAPILKSSKNKVRLLGIDALPPSNGRRNANIGNFAKIVHRNLNLGDGLLIVICGNPYSLALAGGGYTSEKELNVIERNAARTFVAQGPPAAVTQIVREFDASEASGARTGSIALLFIIGVPTAVVILLVRRSKKKKAEELARLRAETMEISAQLAPEYEKLDSDYEYALVSESDPQRKRELTEARNTAGAAFSGSMKRLNEAQTLFEFSAARREMLEARDQMKRARNVLEGRPVDAGLQSAPPPASLQQGQDYNDFEIPPLGTDDPGAMKGYALDFFTSQPVPRYQMVPVDIEIGGQRRRVWASPASAQAAMSGNPQMATVNYNGQQQPWYNAPNYNPWSDFGSQVLQMVALNMILNSVFNRPQYGGYGGYGYGGGYDPGWSGGSWHSGGSWNDSHHHHHHHHYDDNDYHNRDSNYENRMDDASRTAGGASLDSPLFGGWSDSGGNSSDSDSGGASLDMFGSGGGSSWSNDSS